MPAASALGTTSSVMAGTSGRGPGALAPPPPEQAASAIAGITAARSHASLLMNRMGRQVLPSLRCMRVMNILPQCGHFARLMCHPSTLSLIYVKKVTQARKYRSAMRNVKPGHAASPAGSHPAGLVQYGHG